MNVKDYVLELVSNEPGLDNETIAGMVRKKFPGASTTAASVSSIKSVARRNGQLEKAEVTVLSEELKEDEILEDTTGETDEQVHERIQIRFDALDRMAMGVMHGIVPALIGAGPPGLGKSFGIERALQKRKEEAKAAGFDFNYDYIQGAISPVGLYISAWNHRLPGDVIILDDCDSVFADEDSLNILKSMLDSSDKRRLSWRKKSKWLEELGIDDDFEFEGSVIFLTNLDFEKKIETSKGYGVHFKALMDRCLYLHLTIRTIQDCMVRIRQVVYGEKMLEKYGLTEVEIKEIMDYLWDNRKRFYHLSLRLVHQIALLQQADPEHWKDDVAMTKMRAGSEKLAEIVDRVVAGEDVEKALAASTNGGEAKGNGKGNGNGGK